MKAFEAHEDLGRGQWQLRVPPSLPRLRGSRPAKPTLCQPTGLPLEISEGTWDGQWPALLPLPANPLLELHSGVHLLLQLDDSEQ